MMTSEMPLGFLNWGTGRVAPFDAVFKGGQLVDITEKLDEQMKEIGALVIWGGEDIATSLYGETGGKWTDATRKLSQRDQEEVTACLAAIDNGIPIIGVCRGAQLLCALAGGKLVQHVSNHNRGDHKIRTWDHKTLVTSSLHHQMMWPYVKDVNFRLLAWSEGHLSGTYAFDNETVVRTISKPEPEVVWFPAIKGLAIQGHPEFMEKNDEFVQYCIDLVNQFIVKEK